MVMMISDASPMKRKKKSIKKKQDVALDKQAPTFVKIMKTKQVEDSYTPVEEF